jgi:sialic acid synthase SpsE/CMP-N-acetylneuraminic acid synthetase
MSDAATSAIRTLCVILARAGSKGLPNKNVLEINSRPMVQWTVCHARDAQQRGVIDHVLVSTDGKAIAKAAREAGAEVLMRPAELAGDTATVADAARHALENIRHPTSHIRDVVILYGNVPVRPHDLIDRALAKLRQTGCDSVQSVAPVGKMHPYWMKTLGGDDGDVLQPFIENTIDRRQDLPPVYMLDGGIIAVTRASLMASEPANPHAFLGKDRRAIVTEPGAVIDVDTKEDMNLAWMALEDRYDSDHDPMYQDYVAEADGDEADGDEIEFMIRGRRVHKDEPVYVIAEIGVNHDGQVDRALELVEAAKRADADAVKLQLFRAELLLSDDAELAAYQQANADDPYAMLNALQLTVEEMLAVRERAHELGLGFIVTPFSLENFDDMQRLDPDAVKIASPDCVNGPLIERMYALGKPMIISTGAATMSEWSEAFVDRWNEHPTAVMHCVSAYPTPMEQANLGAVAGLASLYPFPVGYSDHTASLMTGGLAAMVGAAILEKHLTYDTAADGPDHAASLGPEDFAVYVRHAREAQSAKSGDEFDEVQDIEQDVRRVSRQSVCAVRDLKAGATIARDDVTVKRPGIGIPAGRLEDVVGRKLLSDVKANRLLRDGDVDWT